MSEGVVFSFRTTRATMGRIKFIVTKLCEYGLMDNTSISRYVRDAVREKMNRDLERLDKN